MPQLLLLAKLCVILLLAPAYKCLPTLDSAESELSIALPTVQPTESKLLPFLNKQQSTQSLDDPPISSAGYPSIFEKGQESSIYLQESHMKKPLLLPDLISGIEAILSKPHLSDLAVPLDTSFEHQNPRNGGVLSDTVPILNTKLTGSLKISSSNYKSAAPTLPETSIPSIFSKGQESSLYLLKFDSKKRPPSPLLYSNIISEVVPLSSKPQLSDSVVPLDKSFQYLDAGKDVAILNKIPFLKAKLTVCALKKLLLKGMQSSTDDVLNPKSHVRIISTNYENPVQRQSSRTKPKKIKIRLKKDNSAQLANDWYGSQSYKEPLVEKKQSASKKFKVFSTHKQAMKFKQKLKQIVRKPKKYKIYADSIEPLKNSLRNRDVISSRKSKTERCYKTRKQDSDGSRTICVTYPESWGVVGTPYAYFYPYYYPYYYYPYYYYGRR